MRVIFPYEEKESNIFPKIKRPVANVYFWSKLIDSWLRYKMIVDSGADYTILPRYCSVDLGISLRRDCRLVETARVGGKAIVYFLKRKARSRVVSTSFKRFLFFIKLNWQQSSSF